MHSVRFKITAILVAAVLVAGLSVFLVGSFTIQAENDRQSVKTMNLITHDTQQSLEAYTGDIEQSVELIGNLAGDTLDSVELVRGGAVGPVAASGQQTPEQAEHLDSYLSHYCERIQEVASVVASHTPGIVTYFYCINPDLSDTQHGFFYSRAGKTGFAEREPIDVRELDPNDTEHTAWYYTTIARGRPSWVGPYKAQLQNELLIGSYLVPIYRTGMLIGVIGMDIPVETLVDQVSSVKVYDTGFACLMDPEGRILYHPEKEAGTTLDLEVSQNIFQQENSGDALIRYTSNGEERQLSFTTLANGMKLAVVAPTSEINASTAALGRNVLPLTALIIAVFAGLSLLAMRLITTPLVRLTAASQRLAAKDYDVELDYTSKDEVGALTDSFKQMRDQLKQDIEELNRKVLTDDLTGLPNQRHFFQLAEEEKARLTEEGKHPVAIFFNLVGMKHFNRQYGFDEGDQLIREVAGILANTFGEQCAARFGQDHFAAISDEEHVEELAANVFEQGRRANNGVNLPISAGIYRFSMEDVSIGVAWDHAKFAGDQRNGIYESGFSYFDADMLKQVENMRYVINHFDQALEENWIVVHYQPIVRAINGHVCDEEALSRWIDPTRGTLHPDDFIPALEEAGLIYKLDLYVVDRVLEKIKLQEESGLTIVSHSVNLSRSDFEVCDIVEEIRSRVDAAGIDRNKISIEITESIIGADFDFMKEQVERFQALGFPVWMDDFGSGYSSLDVLEDIKFDLIKFDMSFTQKIGKSEEGRIVLTELMKMTTALGVSTICEGVETEEQSRFLQEIGCSKLQGFLFSKALPLEGIIERYKAGIQIGYENPAESEYFEAIGKVNLYDLAIITAEDVNENESLLQNAFSTLPMGVMEVKGNEAVFVRTNQSYREFANRYLGIDFSDQMASGGFRPLGSDSPFTKLVLECCETGNRAFLDDKMADGSVVRSFVRRIRTNPVTGATAMVVAVLSITSPPQEPSA